MKKISAIILITATLFPSLYAYNDDGTCGAPSYSCPQFAPCCSKFGYCGATEYHCAPRNCLANCWETDQNPGSQWNTADAEKNSKDPVDEKATPDEELKLDDNDEDDVTQSELGPFRAVRRFPEEQFGVYVRCIDPNVVALTFDDGPSYCYCIGNFRMLMLFNRKHTIKLLDVLEKENVKATFFILARNLDPTVSPQWHQNQQTLRTMVKKGHLMASHSFNHPNFVNVGAWAAEQDMNRADELFKKVLGFYPRLMRPPEGAINGEIAKTLHKLGFYVINWSHDTNDWRFVKHNPNRTLRYVKNRIPEVGKSTQAESVVLLQHDTYENTVKIQKEVIKVLKKKGYRFVTLDECIGVSKPYRIEK